MEWKIRLTTLFVYVSVQYDSRLWVYSTLNSH